MAFVSFTLSQTSALEKKNMNKKNKRNLILGTFVAVAALFVVNSPVYAKCESSYGNGETCYINKRFEIDKDVRIEGDDSWEDKVMDVKKDDVVEFRVKIKNKSDEKADGFDDMKMEDFLPDEMERVGGSGLTEYWDDFKPGETKTFVIQAKIDKDEFDRDNEFEKCIVNKAEVNWDDKFEGSDTATVCYGDEEVKELPETGATEIAAVFGAALMAVGLIVRKSTNLV